MAQATAVDRQKLTRRPIRPSHRRVFPKGGSTQDITRQLAFAALSFVVVGLIGTAGYHVLGSGHWSYEDCLYMTLITLSTVGYGEVLTGMDQVPGARAWTVLLIVLGSGSLVFFVSSLTAFIVDSDLRGVLRLKRMQKSIDSLKDHIIVVGIGATGIHVATELHLTKVPFVVIDTDEERLRHHALETLPGMLYVHGDATDDHVLHQAGIERAKGLAATLPDDKDNVFVTVTARALSSNLRIVAKMTADSAEPKLRRAGANGIVSPSLIGGMRLVSEIIRPSVVRFLDVMLREREETLRFEEVAIPEKSSLNGARLDQTDIRQQTKALVLAVHNADGSYTYNPEANFVLGPGMKLLVLGEVNDIVTLRAGVESGKIGRAR